MEVAIDVSFCFTSDSVSEAIGATVSCLIGSTGCIVSDADGEGIVGSVGVGEGDSVSAVVAVRFEIDGVICGATRWGDESFCVGVDCRTGGEGVDVVDETDWVGAWFGVDAVG